MSCAKAAEPIEMLSEGSSHVQGVGTEPFLGAAAQGVQYTGSTDSM